MLLNSAIICTGTFGEERKLFEQYGFVQENILAYAAAINSWLSDRSPESVEWFLDGRYVFDDRSQQITRRVHSSLIEKDKTKEWLA
jgi:hypothetical protein